MTPLLHKTYLVKESTWEREKNTQKYINMPTWFMDDPLKDWPNSSIRIEGLRSGNIDKKKISKKIE